MKSSVAIKPHVRGRRQLDVEGLGSVQKKSDSHSKRPFIALVSLSVLFEVHFSDVYMVRSDTESKCQFLRLQNVDSY